MKKLRNTEGAGKYDLRISSRRNIGGNNELGDLLYEFPAKTRLTVHRRLDIVYREVKLKSDTGAQVTWTSLHMFLVEKTVLI